MCHQLLVNQGLSQRSIEMGLLLSADTGFWWNHRNNFWDQSSEFWFLWIRCKKRWVHDIGNLNSSKMTWDWISWWRMARGFFRNIVGTIKLCLLHISNSVRPWDAALIKLSGAGEHQNCSVWQCSGTTIGLRRTREWTLALFMQNATQISELCSWPSIPFFLFWSYTW